MNSHVTNLYPSPNGTVAGQNLAVSTSVVQFAAFHTDTKYVMIDVQDNSVYVTFDNSTPSATNGHLLLKEKGLIILKAETAKAAKFIRASADAVVQVSQFLD
jgi:hypothetical protein|tara:strand:+ start:48 stop:353 length:306 start_codon:yes stop_codon:yes gene_type:complete